MRYFGYLYLSFPPLALNCYFPVAFLVNFSLPFSLLLSIIFCLCVSQVTLCMDTSSLWNTPILVLVYFSLYPSLTLSISFCSTCLSFPLPHYSTVYVSLLLCLFENSFRISCFPLYTVLLSPFFTPDSRSNPHSSSSGSTEGGGGCLAIKAWLGSVPCALLCINS